MLSLSRMEMLQSELMEVPRALRSPPSPTDSRPSTAQGSPSVRSPSPPSSVSLRSPSPSVSLRSTHLCLTLIPSSTESPPPIGARCTDWRGALWLCSEIELYSNINGLSLVLRSLQQVPSILGNLECALVRQFGVLLSASTWAATAPVTFMLLFLFHC